MKKLIPVYRVIGYVLIVMAGVLSIFDLLLLLVAIANPGILVAVVIFTGVITYTSACFYFDRRAIQKGKACKTSLRYIITVTGVIAFIFVVVTLWECINYLVHPELVNDMSREMLKSQPSYASAGITKDYLIHLFIGMLYVFMVYCVLLLVHLMITPRLLKQYGYLFEDRNKQV